MRFRHRLDWLPYLVMGDISFTPEQLAAIETVDRSVIVSAAAGSGKTAVLAQRCAYLVADAPDGYRCDVDELVVLTFAEAAAAEMRERIVEALRLRVRQRPEDQRLKRQLALVEAARISTIHSYCLWLIRRWFNLVDVDPSAAVLGAEEATLLKREVLDELFAQLYAAATPEAEPLLGSPEADGGKPDVQDLVGGVCAADFARLVNVYGMGNDRAIATLVLKLFDFISSLPDPDDWLDKARQAYHLQFDQVATVVVEDLRSEIRQQIDHLTPIVRSLDEGNPSGHGYTTVIRAYLDALEHWSRAVENLSSPSTAAKNEMDEDRDRLVSIESFEELRESILGFSFPRARGVKLDEDADDAAKWAHAFAKKQLTEVKERLFRDRIKKSYALFSIQERVSDLERIGPFVATLTGLVSAFGDAYSKRKRRMDVLDFADLERLAHRLLCDEEDANKPSSVASELHRQFKHVLVDEFQDINPIQEAIIRLTSRESAEKLPNNLFVVGDVKQSIYSFRLAAPAIFAQRLAGFLKTASPDRAIALQKNFRSQPRILTAVNLLFAALMRGGHGAIAYDDLAHLFPGRKESDPRAAASVELHLLQRNVPENETDLEERGVPDMARPSRWTPIEREAHLIGCLIRRWQDDARTTEQGAALRYRDVVVLLRAAKVSAERMASMLQSMGIPAHAGASGSLFSAREVQEVLAALHVLDNPLQDIPLASILRSGIFGDVWTEDELVELRCVDRTIPFHETPREYVRNGQNDGLRDRLDTLLNRIDRFRADARRRNLGDVLWSLFESHGYMAYTCGLPNGPQRRANLLKLHELARSFGTFRRQGLHRFLRFVDTLEASGEELSTAPTLGQSEDVVRIMTIHQSKGLEFPVVFVAGLGKRFNLGDRSGSMIFAREAGIGFRVIDSGRLIEYPSLTHQLVADEVGRRAREEEQRILYVAMTRARERLVLVGSQRDVDKTLETIQRQAHHDPPSSQAVESATTPLDWLIPVLTSLPAESMSGFGRSGHKNTVFECHAHTPEEMNTWTTQIAGDRSAESVLHAVARGDPLPQDEPTNPDHPQVDRVLRRLDFVYPYLPTASIPAVIGAGDFKGYYDYTRDVDEPAVVDALALNQPEGARTSTRIGGDAALRGTLTHRVLQHLDYSIAATEGGVRSELDRLTDIGVLPDDQRDLVDAAAISWFVLTPLGESIARAGAEFRREFSFVTGESPSFLDPSIGDTDEDMVMVRGIVDGILVAQESLEVIDFKTDAIQTHDAPQRAERYRPQMIVYARAMSRIWKRPVITCRLVFLHARSIVQLEVDSDRRTMDET